MLTIAQIVLKLCILNNTIIQIYLNVSKILFRMFAKVAANISAAKFYVLMF